MNTEAKLSLAQFLDASVDALPDAPKRAMLPAGKHVIQIVDVSQKELGSDKKEALVFSAKYIQSLELVNAADATLKAGEQVDFTYFTDNAGGLGGLKEFVTPLAQPGMKLSDILPALPNNQFIVTTKVRKWKDKQSGEEKAAHEAVGGLALMGS